MDKKNSYIIVILILITIIFSNTAAEHPDACDYQPLDCFDGTEIPLTEYSYKKNISPTEKKFIVHGTPLFYYNELNKLTPINTNWQQEDDIITDINWFIEKGEYKVTVTPNGEFTFTHKNSEISFRLKGIGFYNKDTQQFHRFVIDLNKYEIDINANKIIWQLPLDSNYVLQYEPQKFRDIFTISQALRTYIKNNKPDNWTIDNTLMGFIYDVDFNRSLIDVNSFDTNGNIDFSFNGTIKHRITAAYAEHGDYNKGFANGQINQNQDLRWERTRKYLKQYKIFLDVINLAALDMNAGPIIFNGTIQVQVTDTNDDGQEMFSIGGNYYDNDNTNITFNGLTNFPGGLMFRGIDIPQGTIISDAELQVHYGHSCAGAGNCNVRWWGVNQADVNTWNDNHLPSDDNKTVSYIDHFNSTDQTPNGSYSSSDLNFTSIVTEQITTSDNWQQDGNIAFVMDDAGFGRTTQLKYRTYDDDPTHWELTINYEGADPDLCEPSINEDWIFNATTLHCQDKNIVTGTGNVYINNDSLLSLGNSKLYAGSFINFYAPDLNVEVLTADDNISASSQTFSKAGAANEYEGGPFYGAGSYWCSEDSNSDHWVQVSFPNPRYIHNIQFPIMYSFAVFSDLNIIINDGVSETTLYENNDFNMFKQDAQNCEYSGNVGGNLYYCILSKTVTQYVQSIRITVDGATVQPGGYSPPLDANLFCVNDILMYGHDVPRQRKYLTMQNSFFSTYYK